METYAYPVRLRWL